MKITLLILMIPALLFFSSCDSKTTLNEKNTPKISYIITNDDMSERNLSFMGGPLPADYKNGLIDSLRNSFVEIYDDSNNIVEVKYYNSIGALYSHQEKHYDSKNRLEKSVEMNVFNNEICTVLYQHTDSLNLLIHKRVTTSCSKDVLDFYYTYNNNGDNTAELVNENNKLVRKTLVDKISTNEKYIKSYDDGNRLSIYEYKYNDKDLLIFEKRNTWEYVRKGDYFEIASAYDYLYKYDKKGNWIERTKQTAQQIKDTAQQNEQVKSEKPQEIESLETEAQGAIKEKLIRKIYYQ